MGKRVRNSPPRFALRFLEWFCPPSLSEGIEGDLVEKFETDFDLVGEKQARRKFVWNTIRFFRPAIILRTKFSLQLINTVMLRSHFKMTYRNILKNKGYSFINIFGLSLGIACCLLMFSYARFELSYDNFHPNVSRTYRVDQTMPFGSEGATIGSTAPPLANVMKLNYPEVEDAMRVNTPGDFIVRYADGGNGVKAFNENHVFAADSNFFSFIGFELKEGNPEKALQGLNKVVISEEVSKKLFGDKPALGKILQLGDDRRAIEVTGVTNGQPENSHFHFDYLLSMETFPEVRKRDWSWVWIHMATYVRLRPDADPAALKEKMKQMAEKVVKPAYQSRGMDYDNAVKGKAAWNFYLQPMRDIHLRSGDNRIGPVGDIRYVITFAVIGIFVLLIAAINFINLSTARATKRAREVGVKKTLGASRSSLVSQFQIESILITFFSTALALVLVEVLRLIIARSAGVEIPLTFWKEKETILWLPLIPLVIGFVAGLYPSFYLTAFRPAHVLKGKLIAGLGNTSLRNGLVVVQFTISIALIAGTILVFQQLRFVSTTSLGFDKENVLLIKGAEKLGQKLDAFKHEIETYSGVIHAGIAMEVPGGGTWDDGFTRENSNVSLPMSLIKTDDNYFKTLNFQLLTGRSFEKERPSDKNAIILNETAVRQFGWTPVDAIGQYLVYPGNDNSRHEIIGVMKDSHYQSLHQAITPLLFTKIGSDIWGDWFVLTVKFRAANIATLIRQIGHNWNKFLDDTPLQYSFLDQELARQYEVEQRLGGLFGIFSGLSIVIAIIGLVGLVSYSAEVRKKEIGIRKVFGASTSQMVVMMNSQHIRLVAIALLLATPLSWWALKQWLNTFAYRIEISPWTFVVSGLAMLMLALLSVAYLAIRAATLNPSQVLKEE